MTDKELVFAELVAKTVIDEMNAKFVRKDFCEERHRPSWLQWTLILGSYGFTLAAWLFLLERMTPK